MQPDSEVITSNATIKAVRVPDSKRMNTLPRYFGRQHMTGDAWVYQSLHSVCEAYSGGLWDFFELSNGGFYMTPRSGGATANSVGGQWLRWRDVVRRRRHRGLPDGVQCPCLPDPRGALR